MDHYSTKTSAEAEKIKAQTFQEKAEYYGSAAVTIAWKVLAVSFLLALAVGLFIVPAVRGFYCK